MSQQAAGQMSGDTRGKHRIMAELKRLDQETRFVEEELEQLSKNDEANDNNSGNSNVDDKNVNYASVACKELLGFVESKPDPLLPVTVGPVNPAWDRWFEGPQEYKGCGCCIL